MTSLSEVYEGAGRTGASLRRLYLGTGLFVVGAALLVAGILVTTTDVLYGGSMTIAQARRIGGVLGGLGLPSVLLGAFSVLPAGRRTRSAAIIGASIAVLGVGLFWHAYPCQWVGSNCGAGLVDLTLPTVGIYFFGSITSFWSLFVGVANFKTRNDPGGTVKMEVTRKGETKIIEVERSKLAGLGGIGFLGGTPDDDVDTQTAPETDAARAQARAVSVSDGGETTTTDFGSQAADRSAATADRTAAPGDTGAEVVTDESGGDADVGDAYCGNCTHFEYVRTADGIQPYCGYHATLMDDMDACSDWTRQ